MRSKELDESRNGSRPTGLVAGSESGAIVAVEVLIEEDAVSPVRIVMKHIARAKDRSLSFRVANEYTNQAIRDIAGDFEKVHPLSGSGRAFNLEIVAVIFVEQDERPYDQQIYGKPDRSPPVRIASKHPTS